MPYKSKAQAAYFNIHRKELEKQGVDVDEWNQASKGKSLPEHTMKHPHHGYTHTTIHHHHDGSHTVEHHHHMPEHSVTHAVPDLAGAKDSLEAHIGEGAPASPAPAAPPSAPPAAPAGAM